jgi:hypothetical protein
MSNIENNLATELEKELIPAKSLRESLAAVDKAASVVPLRSHSFLDQFMRMEKIGDVLNEQVRMRIMELENQFRKKATEMSINHEREAQVLLATHKAEVDELEALLRKLPR